MMAAMVTRMYHMRGALSSMGFTRSLVMSWYVRCPRMSGSRSADSLCMVLVGGFFGYCDFCFGLFLPVPHLGQVADVRLHADLLQHVVGALALDDGLHPAVLVVQVAESDRVGRAARAARCFDGAVLHRRTGLLGG